MWDPLRKICFHLGICRSKLSSYCREVTGLGAHEIVDVLQGKRIAKKMRADLRAFVKAYLLNRGTGVPPVSSSDGKPCTDVSLDTRTQSIGTAPANCTAGFQPAPIGAADETRGESSSTNDAPSAIGRRDAGAPSELLGELWRALRDSRRTPDFHRATFALEFGFPNYLRFYKTCLLCYRKTPGQLEYQILRELLEEFQNKGNLDDAEASHSKFDPGVRFEIGGEPAQCGHAGIDGARGVA